MTRPFRRLPIFFLLAAVLAGAFGATAASAQQSQSEQAVLTALREGNHVLLMRHSLAPGTGDPAGFRLGFCESQRNLNAEGRAQAERIGQTLRRENIRVARVYASRWCRTMETARLMVVGEVMTAPLALDSFFQRRETREASVAALRELLAGLPLDGANTVMVTHQVNVTALTGIFPQSSDIIVLRAGPFDAARSIVGRIRLD